VQGVVSRTVSDLAPDSAACCLVWDTGNRSWAGLAAWLPGWYPGVCCPADARLDCFLNQLGVGLSAVAAVAAVWRRRGLWEAAVGRCRGTGV
jgi:hypothetical protein